MHVQGREQHLLLVTPTQAERDFARSGGFARALKPDHENGNRRGRVQINAARALFSATQRFHQRIIDDFDDLLRGGDGANHLLPHGAFLHARNKVPHHRQRDISFQQRHAHFAQRFGHIGFVQRATAAQPIKNTVELAGQSLKHGAARWSFRVAATPKQNAPLREPSRSDGANPHQAGGPRFRANQGTRRIYPPSASGSSKKPKGARGAVRPRRNNWFLLSD